ncbi:MAG: ribonuclease P protein component [Lachnospiraceae bacterium]|nr:ribonuclease P protein component [Lachnospiraceae bacterium]
MKFSASLKKRSDFQKVYQNGRSVADRNLVLYCLENGTERNHLGISISKKCGNSVVRHRFQRRMREIYRQQEEHFVKGRDFVVIARTDATESSFQELKASFLRLAKRLHAVNVA